MANSTASMVWRRCAFFIIVSLLVLTPSARAQQGYGFLYGGMGNQLSMGVDRGGDLAIFGGQTPNLGAMLFGGGAYAGAGLYGQSPWAYLNGGGYYGGYPMWGANASIYTNPWINPGWPQGNYCYGMPWSPMAYGPGYYGPYYWQNQMAMSGCQMMTCGGFSRRDYTYSSSGSSGGSSVPKPPTPSPSPVPLPSPSPSPKLEMPPLPPPQTEPSPQKPSPPPPPPAVSPSPEIRPPLPSPRPVSGVGEPENTPVPVTDKSCLDRRNEYLKSRNLGDLIKTDPRKSESFCATCEAEQKSKLRETAEEIRAKTLALSDNHIVASAQELMAGFYGTCDVLHPDNLVCPEDTLRGITPEFEIQGGRKLVIRKITDPTQVIATQPYFNQICHDKNLSEDCKGACKSLGIFDFGGVFPFTPAAAGKKSQVSLKPSGGVNIGTGPAAAGKGVDCSAFVSAAIRKSGLRTMPAKSGSEDVYRMTTGFFLRKNPSECVRTVEMDKSTTVKAGDFLTFFGHMMIIESVGADPFGLEKWPKDCSVPAGYLKHLDFNIIHSAAFRGGAGISRMRAADYFTNFTGQIAGFDFILKQACLAKNKGAPAFSAIREGQVTRSVQDKTTKKFKDVSVTEPIFSISRHVGDSQKQCVYGDVELTGANKCAKACLEAAKQKPKGSRK